MKRLALITVLLCVSAGPATTAAPATNLTAPTTAAATRQGAGATELLDGGRVRLVPPAGWTRHGLSDNGLTARYELGEGNGVITVTVTPQQTVFQPEAAPKIARTLGERIREAAKSAGAELLYGPRAEPDERFLLKVRDRQRLPDGQVMDRLQIYKVMQLELVHVVVVARADTPDAAAPMHAAAEQMLAGARLGVGPRPTSFRRTRIRLTVPPDWVEQRSDDPNGLVAIYTNPAAGPARLVVRAKILPKAARDDAARREIALDELIDAERHTPIVPGAARPGEEGRVDDPRFLRKVSRTIELAGKLWPSDLRCVAVGDVLICVAALAPPEGVGAEAFDAISKLADEMAVSIKPLDDKKRTSD